MAGRNRSCGSLQADGGDKRAGTGRVSGDAGQLDLPYGRHGRDREPLRSTGGVDVCFTGTFFGYLFFVVPSKTRFFRRLPVVFPYIFWEAR